MTDDKDLNFDANIRGWARQIRIIKTNELRQAIQQKEMIVNGSANLTNTSLPQFTEDFGTSVDELCKLKDKLKILESV